MRRQVVQSPFSVLFIFYLLAFGVFFFYSLFTFPAGSDGLLDAFQWPYIWTNGFLLFMRYCLPVTLAALAVGYSLLYVSTRSSTQPFSRLVTSHLVSVITLTLLFTVPALGLRPLARGNLEQFDSLSRQARAYLEQADAAFAAQDRESALRNYRHYLAIDPGSDTVMRRADDLGMQILTEAAEEPKEETIDLEALRAKDLAAGKTPYELLDLAERFYEREDYFSAHYYANLAFRIDPARRDAQRLAARAREMIASKDLDRLASEEKELYKRKREGYEHFTSGEHLKAYHLFRELGRSHPDDADVLSYLEKSQAALEAETFFLDEARAIDPMPGPTELLFVNFSQDGEKEIVFISKLVGVEAGVFCKDLEVVRFNRQGLLYHFSAPYGRFADGYINLHGVDRTARGVETLPRFHYGNLRLRKLELPHLLAVSPSLEELRNLKAGSIGSDTTAGIGFFPLWQLRRSVHRYGYLEPFLTSEILNQLLLPFSFLTLSLLGMALGWRLRARFAQRPRARFAQRPRWILLLFMPLFPLVAVFFTSLYLHAQRIVLGFVLLHVSFILSLAVFLVLQGLLLLLMLILLAGQRTD